MYKKKKLVRKKHRKNRERIKRKLRQLREGKGHTQQ